MNYTTYIDSIRNEIGTQKRNLYEAKSEGRIDDVVEINERITVLEERLLDGEY